MAYRKRSTSRSRSRTSATRTGARRRSNSVRRTPRRAARRVSPRSRRGSSRSGGTIKLVIQQAPATGAVSNPLASPLMAAQKPTPGPAKAKF